MKKSKYVYYIEKYPSSVSVYRVNKKTRLFSSWDRDRRDFYDETENAELGPFVTYKRDEPMQFYQLRISERVAYIIAPIMEDQ